METPEPFEKAPIDADLVNAWLAKVPELCLHGKRPDGAQLVERLARFWIPCQPVVYIGLTTGSLRGRVGAYYRTSLGNPRPHAGGHWIRTLAHIERFSVWWAETDTPGDHEDALLDAFAASVSAEVREGIPGGTATLLPLANRQNARGTFRKPHGITRAVVRRPADSSLKRRVTPAGEEGPATGASSRKFNASIGEINAALALIACEHPDKRVTAVEAARELDRLGLLRDSASRPGLPLRKRLRAGDISNAYQEDGRFWFIECTEDHT